MKDIKLDPNLSFEELVKLYDEHMGYITSKATPAVAGWSVEFPAKMLAHIETHANWNYAKYNSLKNKIN